MSLDRPEGLSPESLLGSHQFTLSVDKGLPFEEVEFTEWNKLAVARAVIDVMGEYGLELDPNVPQVRLVVTGYKKSELVHQGKSCIDLEGRVFIFTTTGPKHFPCKFAMLAENLLMMGEGGDA